nr:unnamed protein product [Spirometra erinaceieuropaei]
MGLTLHIFLRAATSDWRPCGDCRILSNVTVPDRYPVPHFPYFAGALFGKSVFSKTGLVRASHQIPVAPEDVSKIVVTILLEICEFLCMPFGLHKASQTFQRFVDKVLRGSTFVNAYIDNLLVASSTAEEHMEHLATPFGRLQQFGVVLNPSSCVFGVPSGKFLGHMIDSSGIYPLPSKFAVIRDFPSPSSKHQLQRFLGMVNFYCRLLPHCADTILPLASLLSGPKVSFEMSADTLANFDKVKVALADATFLTHFSLDAPTSLMVDVSNVAVAFFSRKLSPAEAHYNTFGRVLLAVFLAVKQFRHFLEGRNFTMFTDHEPLSFAKFISDNFNPREIRQVNYSSQFTPDIRHIDGSRNEVVDALSRFSIAYLQLSSGIDLAEMAAEQRRVGFPCDEDVSGLQLQDLHLTTGNDTILYGISTASY